MIYPEKQTKSAGSQFFTDKVIFFADAGMFFELGSKFYQFSSAKNHYIINYMKRSFSKENMEEKQVKRKYLKKDGSSGTGMCAGGSFYDSVRIRQGRKRK